MEQRRLRLGDNVDDYCPRERRITTHVIVALVADEVKQTRCTTCDAEHKYKAAKAPPKRRLKAITAAALGEPAAPARAVRPADSTPTASIVPDPTVADPPTTDQALAAGAELDEGSVRRPLIRATLPRLQGQVLERRMPEFTVRQSDERNGNAREGNSGGHSGKRLASGRAAGNGGFQKRSRDQGRSHTGSGSGERRQGRSSDRGRSRSRSGRSGKKPS